MFVAFGTKGGQRTQDKRDGMFVASALRSDKRDGMFVAFICTPHMLDYPQRQPYNTAREGKDDDQESACDKHDRLLSHYL